MRSRPLALATCVAAVAIVAAALSAAGHVPAPARAATDTQPPTTPGGIRNAGNVSDPQTQIRVAWTASTDDVGVTGYDVARNGVHVDTRPATGLDHASSGLTCGTSYTFAVRAKDAAGNFSAPATLTTSTAACAQPSPTGACGGLTGAPHITKAVWIWFENHAFTSITPTAAPYFNQIKRECGYASNYRSVTNLVSLPEYLASTGGSNHGVTDDAGPASHQLNFDNIFRQIDRAGKTWRSYQQGMTSNCMKTGTGRYAPKHNPATYYVGANGANSCATSDVPLPASPTFGSDFTIVEPNLCNSMHDCSVATGDAWLKSILPKIVASTDYRAGNAAVFVTFDEGAGGNETLFTLVLSRFTTPGTISGAAFNHYALLRTTESILGLPCLLNACTAGDMRSAFGLI